MAFSKESIQLISEEKELFEKIEDNIKKCRERFEKDVSREEIINTIEKNAKLCVKLHMSLKKRGFPPIHSKYMIKNRGTLTSESFEFYNHFHPQEDLVKFIKNPTANTVDIKPDVTMGEKFSFKVYSKRWGHYDTYNLKRNADGWYVSFISIKGQCDSCGEPYLYKNFHQDWIACPKEEIKSLLSSIWARAENGASKETVQKYLDEVADYVSNCERNKPDHIHV